MGSWSDQAERWRWRCAGMSGEPPSTEPYIEDEALFDPHHYGAVGINVDIPALLRQVYGGYVHPKSPDHPEVRRAVEAAEAQIARRRREKGVDEDDPCPRLLHCNCGGYGYQARWGHAPYCCRCGALM